MFDGLTRHRSTSFIASVIPSLLSFSLPAASMLVKHVCMRERERATLNVIFFVFAASHLWNMSRACYFLCVCGDIRTKGNEQPMRRLEKVITKAQTQEISASTTVGKNKKNNNRVLVGESLTCERTSHLFFFFFLGIHFLWSWAATTTGRTRAAAHRCEIHERRPSLTLLAFRPFQSGEWGDSLIHSGAKTRDDLWYESRERSMERWETTPKEEEHPHTHTHTYTCLNIC